jgi:hypothetical protein
MDYLQVFALGESPCPDCGVPVLSAKVNERTGRGSGNDYTVHRCPKCPTVVRRVTLDGKSHPVSPVEETEVLGAFNMALGDGEDLQTN